MGFLFRRIHAVGAVVYCKISQQVFIKLANTYKSQLPFLGLGSALLCYYYDVPHQHQPSLLPAQHSTLHPQPTYPCRMASPNGLICFTNCLLPCEDGSLVEKDLWIAERRGVVLDSQVRAKFPVLVSKIVTLKFHQENVLLDEAATRYGHRCWRKYCQPWIHRHSD